MPLVPVACQMTFEWGGEVQQKTFTYRFEQSIIITDKP